MALARHGSYYLFSRLFLYGISQGEWDVLQRIAELAAVLPASFDPDQTAAEHYTLFQFNLHPYQSIFLDSSGLLGGEEMERVNHNYAAAGFIAGSDTSPDHIGQQFAFLAFLCGAEADAHRDRLPQQGAFIQQLQRDFMREHLLRWLPAFVVAVSWQETPFYNALARLGFELALSHVLDLDVTAPPFALPTSPDLLADTQSSLRDIAQWLTTPPDSGFFLSRGHIARMGRTLQLPAGFGERRQLLTNLLRAAGQYEQMPALLHTLQALVNKAQAQYQQMSSDYPLLISFLHPWQQQLQHSQHQLNAIQQQMAND